MNANIYPYDGKWLVRFHKDEVIEAWNIEFKDPQSWCQTIAVPLLFTTDDAAKKWFQESVLLRETAVERFEDWFEAEVESSNVGQLVLDLHFASRRDEEDSSPWFYASYFRAGCQPIRVDQNNRL